MQVQVADRYKALAGAYQGGNKEKEDARRFNLEIRSRQMQGSGRNKVQEGKDAGRSRNK
jgi:hypothetical protein